MGLANQTAQPGRTTLLEAVNILLTNIGESPVQTIDTETSIEAGVAERTILEIHKEGQTRGWTWNREYGYEFQRDALTNEVVIPAAVVLFAPDEYEYAGRYQLRGQRVYDTLQRTYEIEDSSIKADIISLLPWNDCPEPFNRWATIRAARVFSDRVLASDSIFKYTSTDEERAWLELFRMETEQAKPNVLTGGRGLAPFPTYEAARGLLGRGRGGRLIGG